MIVYGNDISAKKTAMAFNNASIYHVEDNIIFTNKDFLSLDKYTDFKTAIDVVFISPPWGGVSYAEDPVYNLDQIKPNLKECIRKAFVLADNVVLFLPRNTDIKQLQMILLEFEQLYLNESKECIVTVEALIKGKTKITAIVVFIGPLFKVFMLIINIAKTTRVI